MVKTEGSLKDKRRVIIHTCQNKGHDLHGNKSNMVLSTNHISMEENSCFESNNNEGNEAPYELGYGNISTVDELKELNLGMSDDPRLVFVSALLSTIEQELFQVINGLQRCLCMDIQEMLGPSPKLLNMEFVQLKNNNSDSDQYLFPK